MYLLVFIAIAFAIFVADWLVSTRIAAFMTQFQYTYTPIEVKKIVSFIALWVCLCYFYYSNNPQKPSIIILLASIMFILLHAIMIYINVVHNLRSFRD